MEQNLSEVHLSLAESAHLVHQPLTDLPFVAGHADSVPKSVVQALSPSFVADWGPAIDRENAGFLHHACFEAVTLPPVARTLPGLWVFTRKRDGSPKARFCVGGHRQIPVEITFSTRTIVLCHPVWITVFCWPLPPMRTGLFIKQTSFKPFFTVNLMMLIFSSTHLLAILARQVVF